MRVYVLKTSIEDKFSVYLYDEGIVRFTSEEYELANFNNHFIHLTNYCINKKNQNNQSKETNNLIFNFAYLKQYFQEEDFEDRIMGQIKK
jgi:tubulin polyglutamylase TTLL2